MVLEVDMAKQEPFRRGTWRNRRQTVGTVCDAFVLAENIQLVTAEIYMLLSRRLEGSSELKALFALLSGEERSRAKRIREATKRCRLGRVAVEAKVDVLKLRLLLAQTEECYERILHAPIASANFALKLARHLESELTELRAEAFVGDTDPELRQELERTAAAERGHAVLAARLAMLEAEEAAKEAEEEWQLLDLTATSVAVS